MRLGRLVGATQIPRLAFSRRGIRHARCRCADWRVGCERSHYMRPPFPCRLVCDESRAFFYPKHVGPRFVRDSKGAEQGVRLAGCCRRCFAAAQILIHRPGWSAAAGARVGGSPESCPRCSPRFVGRGLCFRLRNCLDVVGFQQRRHERSLTGIPEPETLLTWLDSCHGAHSLPPSREVFRDTIVAIAACGFGFMRIGVSGLLRRRP